MPKPFQYAKRVWHIGKATEAKYIESAIQKTRDFFESLGIKTHLYDHGIEASHQILELSLYCIKSTNYQIIYLDSTPESPLLLCARENPRTLVGGFL